MKCLPCHVTQSAIHAIGKRAASRNFFHRTYFLGATQKIPGGHMCPLPVLAGWDCCNKTSQLELISNHPGGWKCSTSTLAWLGSGEGFFQVADGPLLTVSTHGRRRAEHLGFLVQRHEFLSWGLLPHDQITPQRPYFLKPSQGILGLQHTNSEVGKKGHNHSLPCTVNTWVYL